MFRSLSPLEEWIKKNVRFNIYIYIYIIQIDMCGSVVLTILANEVTMTHQFVHKVNLWQTGMR